MTRLQAVVLRSPAYSGTTWTALVLASHPEALAIGAGDRAWSVPREEADNACLIHGPDCTFWPRFLHGYDRNAPFLPQLAEYSGKRVFTINNPSPNGIAQVLDHPDVEIKYVKQVRDGRATLRSWMRHHPERYADFYDALRAWLHPSWQWLAKQAVPASAGAVPLLRYEDLVSEPLAALRRVGAYLGLDYDESALRYWEHDHHLPTGNSGVIYQLRRMAGLRGFDYHRQAYYDRVIEESRREPLAPVADESWRSELGEIDRVAYDFIMGPLHEAFGYPRERFPMEAILAFARRYDPPATAEQAVAQIPRFSRDAAPPPKQGSRAALRQVAAPLRSLGRRFGLAG